MQKSKLYFIIWTYEQIPQYITLQIHKPHDYLDFIIRKPHKPHSTTPSLYINIFIFFNIRYIINSLITLVLKKNLKNVW